MLNDPYSRAAFRYREAAPIAPHDTNALARVPNEIYVGVAGDVTLRPEGSDADVTFKNAPAGLFLYVRATYIRATGTTATNLIGVYP